jgi:hypothetical protein
MAKLLTAAMLSAALAASPGSAAANGVYKCSGGGGVVYQDAPCSPGTELRNFATDPPSLSVIPGTPAPRTAPAPAASTKAERAAESNRARTAKNNDAKANQRRFIQVGMSTAEVIERIGRPDVDARNLRGKGFRWSYLPKDGDPNTITTVTLVDGRVADVERKVVH